MTIVEIESTLQTLQKNHPDINEGMLVTLLTASGWEEKIIKDAVAVFKSSQLNNSGTIAVKETIKKTNQTSNAEVNNTIQSSVVSIPKVDLPRMEVMNVAKDITSPIVNSVKVVQQNILPTNNQEIKKEESPSMVYYDTTGKEEALLPVFEDDGKELPKVTEDLIIPLKKETETTASILVDKSKITEPQSLINPVVEQKSKVQEIEPPANLPLKPFDSTPHIWQFSRYKEVFHGDKTPLIPKEEKVIVVEHQEKIAKKGKFKRTGFDLEDEGLIFLTGTTLLIILLLLAYMYSNGRF